MDDAATTSLELRDAAVPESLIPAYSLGWWWTAVAGLLMLLGLAILLLRKRRKTSAASPAEIRQQAFREADAALAGTSAADARDAAVCASLTVRKYLSIAAQDPALFETHEEFLTRHEALAALTPAARAAAADGFARLASLKYAPTPADAEPAVIIADSRELLQTLHHGFAG